MFNFIFLRIPNLFRQYWCFIQAEPLYEAVVQNMETKNTDQRCEENYLFVSTQNDVITYVF